MLIPQLASKVVSGNYTKVALGLNDFLDSIFTLFKKPALNCQSFKFV